MLNTVQMKNIRDAAEAWRIRDENNDWLYMPPTKFEREAAQHRAELLQHLDAITPST